MEKYLLLAIFLFSLPMKSQVTVLKYSDHESKDEMRTKFLREVFFPEVEKQSEGRIRIEPHWNGELAISYDALKKVREGKVADITTVVPEYDAPAMPYHQILKGFLVGPTGDDQVRFFRKMYEDVPELKEELHKNNLEPLFLSTGYGVGFFSREKLNSLQDMKGQRWRTASFWHKDYLQNFGAIPVTIPWGDQVYKAFADKTLDGMMVNVDGGYQLKVYEHAPYILASEKLWLGHIYIVAMNRETWQKLSKPDQIAFKKAAEISYKKLGKITHESYYQELEKLKSVGATNRLLTDQELKNFVQDVHEQETQEKWVKDQENKGLKGITKIYSYLKEHLQKFAP